MTKKLTLPKALKLMRYYSMELERSSFPGFDEKKLYEAENNLKLLYNALKGHDAYVELFECESRVSELMASQPGVERDRFETVRGFMGAGLHLPVLLEQPTYSADECGPVICDGHGRSMARSSRGNHYVYSIVLTTKYPGDGRSPYMDKAKDLGFKHVKDLVLIEKPGYK